MPTPGKTLRVLQKSVLPLGSRVWGKGLGQSHHGKGQRPCSCPKNEQLVPCTLAGVLKQLPRLKPRTGGTGTAGPWHRAPLSTRRAVKTHRSSYETPATYFTLPAFVLNSQIWPLSSFCPSRQINWSRS